MSNAKMLIPAALPGMQVPEGYILVQAANVASNSKPTYGKNWSRNQKRRERAAQLAANGSKGSARNPSAAPPPAASEARVAPVVAQPKSPATAEAEPGLSPCSGTDQGDVIVESDPSNPGYHTADYQAVRADKLAIMNQNNLSAEAMLNHVQKLLKFLYSFARVLASADPGSEREIVGSWRYTNNGSIVIAGGNVISTVCEILFYFKLYGNPVQGDTFLTPVLDCINIHASMKKGNFLQGWTEEEILQLHPDQIVTKLDSVTRSETFAILKKFLNVLDNCGQLAARLPQSIYQPCYKFVGRTDEPRWINDAYLMGSSTRFNQALNTLVRYVQKPHVPLLGVNAINVLLRGTGISLSRFTGFAQAEGRVVDWKSKSADYPTSLDLLNLCGLPLPAQYQMEEIQKLKCQMDLQAGENQRLKDRIDHLINVQVQNATLIKELKDIILQAQGAQQTAPAATTEPSIDDKQSIDHLLADEEGHEMEQEVVGAQHPEPEVAQGVEVDGVPTPHAHDVLSAAVDSLMVDLQEQEVEQF